MNRPSNLSEMAEVGAKRAVGRTPVEVIILSVMAGGFITVGALFSTLIATGTENEGIKRLLEGFGFSVGFFLVVRRRLGQRSESTSDDRRAPRASEKILHDRPTALGSSGDQSVDSESGQPLDVDHNVAAEIECLGQRGNVVRAILERGLVDEPPIIGRRVVNDRETVIGRSPEIEIDAVEPGSGERTERRSTVDQVARFQCAVSEDVHPLSAERTEAGSGLA